jgi:proteic killer suppression protein
VILSWNDRDAEKVFNDQRSRRWHAIARVAQRRLYALHAAHTLEDLAQQPGNRLEPLSGDRQGQHSIRINDRYRICFVWRDGHAHDVEIVDYH